MISNVTSAPQPTSALTMQGPGGVLGKDEFLKLLVAQMRHQDPLSPMKGEELAVQLAQFSSVEQLMNLNATMSAQQGLNGAIVEALNGNSAVAVIGKDVVALGDKLVIQEDAPPPNLVFSVGGAGGSAVLRVLDANGKVVASQDLGFVSGGRQSVTPGAEISELEPGVYTYEVEVLDDSGAKVPVQTFSTGRVDGVRYGASGPVLTVGPLEIPLNAIAEITAAVTPTQAVEEENQQP